MYSYLSQNHNPLQATLFVDLSSALIAHIWFRKYEPQDIMGCLFRVAFFATAPVVAAVVALPSPWVNGPLHLGLFLAFLLSSITIYRISPFHPLAKYPGPVICKISKIWGAWLSHQGKIHLYYGELHKKYGPIVRIGPNELSVVEVKLIPNILGQQGMPKGPMWDGRLFMTKKRLKDSDRSLISIRDYNYHSQRRKPWNRAFGPAALQDYEEFLVDRGSELIERLKEICMFSQDKIGHTDIAQYISYWSFDFMGNMAFGKSFGLMRQGDKDGYLHGLDASVEIPAVTQMIPWSSAFFRSIPLLNEGLQKFNKFAIQQARNRSSQVTEKKDLFYHLAANMNIDDDKPPWQLLSSNVALAIIAGSDTTASVLSCIVYCLLRYPDYLKRLQEELDAAFPPSEHAAIRMEQVVNLKLLNAIINEGLRLYPPVPSGLQRSPAKDSGGKLIGDMFIPEGTAVTVPPHVLHRDGRYFSPNPDQFWPERWYTQSDKIILDRSAFIPFSYGPANCAARSLAMSELRYITAILAYNFDFWFEDGYDPDQWERDLKDQFVTVKGKLPVRMKQREF